MTSSLAASCALKMYLPKRSSIDRVKLAETTLTPCSIATFGKRRRPVRVNSTEPSGSLTTRMP